MADDDVRVSANVTRFLERFFRVQRMHEWRIHNPESWARFSDLEHDGTVNSAQRRWLGYAHRNPTTHQLEEHGFPAVTNLTNDEWEELYKSCQQTWQRMNRQPDLPIAVREFVLETRELFNADGEPAATAATRTAIHDLLQAVKNLQESRNAVADFEKSFGISERVFRQISTEFNALAPGTVYRPSKENREAIQKLANSVIYSNNAQIVNIARHTPNIDNIIDDAGWDEPRVTAATIARFQGEYTNMFARLCASDNTELFDAFKANEPGAKPVTSMIEAAKKNIDYDDTKSKNHVPPKHEDKLNFIEQIQKWAGDTYEDYFKKYEGLRGHRVFNHPREVQSIVRAIDKEGIKPTDGLKALSGKIDGIVGKLRISNPHAAEALEWFGGALKEFAGDPKMAHTMEGALKNGRQMRNLVAALIMYAARDTSGKARENAEIAMELLTVIKYGNTTSATLDYLADEKQKGLFTLLSDKDYSWNKNEGMKFITNAMDKTMRWAFLGVGRAGAFLVNKWRQRGTKFNERFSSDTMRAAYNTLQTDLTNGRAAAQAAYESDRPGAATPSIFRQRYDQALSNEHNVLGLDATGNRIPAGAGLREGRFQTTGMPDLTSPNEDLLSAQRAELRRDSLTISRYESDKRQYERTMSILQQAAALRAEIEASADPGFITEKENEIRDLTGDGHLDIAFAGIPRFPGNVDLLTTRSSELRRYARRIEISRGYATTKRQLDDAYQLHYDRSNLLNQYERATQQMHEAEVIMHQREQTYNEWDNNHQNLFDSLMSYWDTLQDGRWTGHIGSAKRFQQAHAEQLRRAIENNRAHYHVH